MSKNYSRMTVCLISALILTSLSGCAHVTSSRMSAGSVSMAEAYRSAIDGAGARYNGCILKPMRAQVPRPARSSPNNDTHTDFHISKMHTQI